MRALNPDGFDKFEWDFFVDKAVAMVVANSSSPSTSGGSAVEGKTSGGSNARVKDNVPTFVSPDSVELFNNFASLFPQLLGKLHLHEADV